MFNMPKVAPKSIDSRCKTRFIIYSTTFELLKGAPLMIFHHYFYFSVRIEYVPIRILTCSKNHKLPCSILQIISKGQFMMSTAS